MNPLNALIPADVKRKSLIDFAMKDEFTNTLLHTLNDYGLSINFSLKPELGAYHPQTLSTERLDTPEKYDQFITGFKKIAENGELKAKITLPALYSNTLNAHLFIHELIHAWQDMHGLYFMPLLETNHTPPHLDAHSNIVAFLFNEAFAQTEAIRICWSINHKTKDDRGWKGALKHSNFSTLALNYDKALQSGMDEQRAAAMTFTNWYSGDFRSTYETQAMHIYKTNAETLHIKPENLRRLTYDSIQSYIPDGIQGNFLDQVDWTNSAFNTIKSSTVQNEVSIWEEINGKAENTNITDIKCGAPLYIWNRIRQNEIAKSQIPAQMLQQGTTIAG